MKIAIASDHGGFNLKGIIKSYLQDAGHSVQDFGPDTPVSTDYPEYALKVAREMAGGAYDFGILILRHRPGHVHGRQPNPRRSGRTLHQ